ncbi:hypothetical protein Q8F55_004815 [Vanrija albida]|uniref:Histidine kinase domain-containing protein n=1 Tax=Vanrija albida TaxID=181172 RepID=A0ABR3Q0V6_9TREE
MLPTADDYKAHGLYNVELDPDTGLGDHPTAAWLSGSARLVPTPAYPLIDDKDDKHAAAASASADKHSSIGSAVATAGSPYPPSSAEMVPAHSSSISSIDDSSSIGPSSSKKPALRRASVQNGGRVRFHFCPHGDSASAAYFRRTCQVKALDTVHEIGARQWATMSVGSTADDSDPPISSPGLSDATTTTYRRFQADLRFVAWWEDDLGLWLVLQTEELYTLESLSGAWAEVVGRSWPQPCDDEPLSGSTAPDADTPRAVVTTNPMSQIIVGDHPSGYGGPLTNGTAFGSSRFGPICWADACDLLFQCVACLQALHDRHISLNWCHPKCFAVINGRVVVDRFWHVTAMPGFSLPHYLSPALAASTLFTREPLDHTSSNLTEEFVFRHLRYLAPEAAISRRVSHSNDIYGWGVLAYELLTGSTIDGGPETPDLHEVDLLADVHRHVTNEVTSPAEYLERIVGLSGGGDSSLDMPPKQLSDIIMRALSKDPEDRYHRLDALAYDLRKLSQIVRADGDLSKFTVGEVDRMSRFSLPRTTIERQPQRDALDAAFDILCQDSSQSSIVCVWGQSGTGKSRLVEDWAGVLEESNRGRRCLVGRARPDEHVKKPLTSFVQIFQSLLDRVLTDPREDAKEWLRKMKAALGSQWMFFAGLLSQDARRLIGDDTQPRARSIDWENFLVAFRSWSRRLLQLFATKERPLILVIDDSQWLAADEVEIWRHIIDGSHPLNHVLAISLMRANEPPPPSALLSISSTSIEVRRLTEDGVAQFISTCLNGRVSTSTETIVSFLYGETGGSPLFLRTLMTTLVKEGVVAFDYDSLQWRFDLVSLQSHLSDSGFDAYLEGVMRRLPSEVQQLLILLSRLPSAGFPLRLLAMALDKTATETDNIAQVAVAAGALTVRNGTVRFTHDRQKMAAYRLIPAGEAGSMHQRLFKFLSLPDLLGDYVFDAVEHALTARELGTAVAETDVILRLLLDATQRAASSASFTSAKHYVDHATRIVEETGGIDGWITSHRTMYFRYVRLATEIASVFHEHAVAFDLLEQIKPYCKSSMEKISIATLLVRQLIAANKHHVAVERLLETLDEFGYNPENPTAVKLWRPLTAADVEQLSDELVDDNNGEETELTLIMSLIAYAGPTIYITLPERRHNLFILGLSVIKAHGKIHEGSGYILSVHSITNHDAPVQYALMLLSKRVARLRPNRFLTSAALIANASQSHRFMPLAQVGEAMEQAFESSFTLGDYEIACYVGALDLAARLFDVTPVAWDIVSRRYELVKAYSTLSHRGLVNIPLQYGECLSRINKFGQPWDLEGSFFGFSELEAISGLALHQGVFHAFTLRLKLMFNAPEAEIRSSFKFLEQTVESMEGLIFGQEGLFLLAVAEIRLDLPNRWLGKVTEFLGRYAKYSEDVQDRISFLRAVPLLKAERLYTILDELEGVIQGLEGRNNNVLAGWLNFWVADEAVGRFGSSKLAEGFIRASFEGFYKHEAWGLCQMLQDRWPNNTPDMALPRRGPAEAFSTDNIMPPLHRPSLSGVSEAHQSSKPTEDTRASEAVMPNDNLDTLTLMRSSLALAQEKDSLVLLGTLLRILCQFARCDYAAIGLCDEEDRSILRLKAAGPFQRIVAYDLDVSDDASQAVCPASIMLHVARTGIPITKPAKVSRLRSDPFYNERQPRALLCLPIINQGVQSGVILLLSMTSASAALQSEQAREVVSTLATFAYIIHLHHAFARRLKAEVTQRTRELTAALQAKTHFLSQCSHELRSPLAAIMGLTSVLEASPGLTSVQREHLQTILASGQDLLSLISNILDHSKLESNSVLLEHIPFNVRDVVESALDTIAPVAQSKTVELTPLSMFKNDPPGLIGDPFRVKQVLLNLLSNAVKFTPPGGKNKKTARVTVERSWAPLDKARIKIKLTITDTGVGIPPSKLHKLFKSFSQVDESITRSYGGSGLGLVISRDLARLLGGDCIVESEFGKGSTFTFTFIAMRDPAWKPMPLRRFPEEQPCWILSARDMVWGVLLEEDLKEFNCNPTRFTKDPQLALQEGTADGLNSGQFYNIMILDTTVLDRDILAQMRKLQPNAQFFYVSRATQISSDMDKLQIPVSTMPKVTVNLQRDHILARPLKFNSIYETLLPVPADGRAKATRLTRKKFNKNLGKEKPLEVLVVDDSATNIAVCCRILELWGYNQVDSAADGLQAVEAAERKRYDLILLDLQMPVLDGFGALQRIQSSPLAGEPCIVSLSANVDKATQSRCIDAGFFDVLTKPVDIPRLGEILAQVYEFRHGSRAASTPLIPSVAATPPALTP